MSAVWVLITVMLMLTVQTLTVPSPAPVTRDTLEMAPAVMVSCLCSINSKVIINTQSACAEGYSSQLCLCVSVCVSVHRLLTQ